MRNIDKLETAFSRYIREWRTTNSVSLDTLAEKMNSSKSYIWGLENGRHAPSMLTAGRLVAILQTDLDNIYKLLDEDRAHYEHSRKQ